MFKFIPTATFFKNVRSLGEREKLTQFQFFTSSLGTFYCELLRCITANAGDRRENGRPNFAERTTYNDHPWRCDTSRCDQLRLRLLVIWLHHATQVALRLSRLPTIEYRQKTDLVHVVFTAMTNGDKIRRKSSISNHWIMALKSFMWQR